jgi:hypothetical protein
VQKIIAVVASLAVFLIWEAVRPFFAFDRGHWLRSGQNALLTSLLFAGVMAWVLSQVTTEPFGLLGLIAIPEWVRFVLTLLVLPPGAPY